MKAIIAEKPSVAREIAALIGATNKCDGYIKGDEHFVTWAFGHLVELAMPQDYGLTGFRRENLPILPDPFLLTPKKVREGKNYTLDKSALKQLKAIEQVFSQSDSIIVATDAGREGELIFRYIYEYLKCDKPFQRLWISSLTEKAIKKGLENLLPGNDFKSLYHAGRGRSQADWLVGINASQSLCIAAGNGVYSLGRVQTPTLALICKRYIENKNFETLKYFKIEILHSKEFIDFKSLSNQRWDDKKLAEDTLKAVNRGGVATVTSLVHKSVSEQPPLLFDLTGLQKEANKKLGFTAEETLDIAQGLYEKKFITYPRTGSKYIPEDMWEEVPALVRTLDAKASCKDAVSKVHWGRFNKRIVNDLKVTDHHGLLITEKAPSGLSVKEDKIYDMVAIRLLEAISGICSKEITDITLQVLHHDFILKGSRITIPGWRAIKGNFIEEDGEPIIEIPELKVGDVLKIRKAEILEKRTKPPALYTEADLLSVMENAGRDIANDDERKALQGIGIGTPATRAAIIETLFKRAYIRREKKILLPTEKGLKVYEIVKDKRIADVAMTAEWEMALQKIENHQADATDFLLSMKAFTISVTQELLSISIENQNQPDLVCPKCKAQILLIREKVVKCRSEDCNWIQFRNVCGVNLSLDEIENLVGKGKTSLIKGMKSKSGKKFNAYIVLNSNCESAFEFEHKSKKVK